MKIAITICATKSYAYAIVAQARRVQGMILRCAGITEGIIILVGDDCEEMRNAERLYRDELLPDKWSVRRIEGNFRDGHKNYQHAAQLVIARMRSAACEMARKLNVDYCLSLDSDVLPQSNSLGLMIHSLGFDDGYYGVSTCPYPSQGGGDFLGGRGTPDNTILPDAYPEERLIPKHIIDRIASVETRLKKTNGIADESITKEQLEIRNLIDKCELKGDVFFLNSNTGVVPFVQQLKSRLSNQFGDRYGLGWKVDGLEGLQSMVKELDSVASDWKPTGYRRRGWCSSAFPAIGKGAMLPTDWCGFGCTLMNKEALALCQFDGYDGSGTEDLYIVFKRWYRAGIRINMITHSPADHVIRDRGKKGKYVLLQAHHEDRNAECVGHLRIERRPWFQQVDGESTPKKKKQVTCNKVEKV